MEPLSSTLPNERMAHKRPISVITIDDDSDQNDNKELSPPAVKREKHETTTETIKDEISASNSLIDNGEEKLHGLNATEVSNASAIDGETSAEHFGDQTFSVTDDNNESNDIIKPPNFLLEATTTGKRRMIVFTSDDKTICYKLYNNHDALFHCNECWRVHNKTVAAKLLQDENGDDYVQMVHQHLCEPVKYVPRSPYFRIQPKEIINTPNYEVQLKQNGKRILIIFVQTNPNVCYYYRNKKNDNFICFECERSYKKSISANILKDKDGIEYVQVNAPHLCKPVPYIANKWHVIQGPNFFLHPLNQKLAVFNSNDRNSCHHYTYSKTNKSYICAACISGHQKYVSAKLIKDENGNECLQANKKHLCDPFIYKISDNFYIVKSPNFTLVMDESNCSILRVYASHIRSSGYNFTQMGSSYACTGCLLKNEYFMAKFFKDENEEEIVLLWKDQQRHVCLPFIYC